MAVQILKEIPIQTFEDFIQKYHFEEISRAEFNLLKNRRRPLRRFLGTALYGYRTDSRITGITTIYFFAINTKAYRTELQGALTLLWNDMLTLIENEKFYTNA